MNEPLSRAEPAPEAAEGRSRRAIPEALGAYAVAAVATAGITFVPRLLPGLDGYVHLLLGGLFLLLAVKLSQREPGGMARHGIDLAGLLVPPDPNDERPAGPLGVYDLGRAIRRAAPSALRETGVAVGLALLIFPPFMLAFAWWNQPTHELRFVASTETLEFALTQLLVVALPEEAFFRGYLQTRLHDRWPPRGKILGVALDWRVWLLQAALFAAIHFASIQHPARLAVFFPGLLFGWMRAWRGGIGAAMLLHAMSNVLADLLEKGWLL